MANVLIKVDQAGASPGVAGQAREDLVLGTLVTVSAIGGPYLDYQWSIPSPPVDIIGGTRSSVAIASATASATQLSPIDTQGTYLVRLAVDSGSGLGANPEDNASITFYAGDALNADPTGYPRRPIATGETTEHNVPDAIDPPGNKDGWARERARWDEAAKAGGGGSGFTAGNDLLGTSTSQTVQGISAPLITPTIAWANDIGSGSLVGPGASTVSTSAPFFRFSGGKGGPANVSSPGGAGGTTQYTTGAGGDGTASHIAGPGGKVQVTGGGGGLPNGGIIGAGGNIGGDLELDGGQTTTSSSFTSVDHGRIQIGKNLKNGAVFSTQRIDAPVTDAFASTITFDLNAGSFHHVVLTNNVTLALIRGQDGGDLELFVEQDGTGSRLVTFSGAFNFGVAGTPTLSTAGGKIDIVRGRWLGTKLYVTSVQKGY